MARATLHNRDEIARKDIRVGDFVFVEKAGEVIPAVIGVNLERRTPECVPYKFPGTCPACGAAVVQLAVPVIVALGGVTFIEEPLTMSLVVSGTLILGGIAIVIAGRTRTAPQ